MGNRLGCFASWLLSVEGIQGQECHSHSHIHHLQRRYSLEVSEYPWCVWQDQIVALRPGPLRPLPYPGHKYHSLSRCHTGCQTSLVMIERCWILLYQSLQKDRISCRMYLTESIDQHFWWERRKRGRRKGQGKKERDEWWIVGGWKISFFLYLPVSSVTEKCWGGVPTLIETRYWDPWSL